MVFVKRKNVILSSEYFTPGAAHIGPLNLDLLSPDRDLGFTLIFLIATIVVVHFASDEFVGVVVGLGGFVAEFEVLV